MKNKETWIFTFGVGQKNEGKYVRIHGSFFEARKKMFERYGDKWAFQYSEEEWERMRRNPKRLWQMETELDETD